MASRSDLRNNTNHFIPPMEGSSEKEGKVVIGDFDSLVYWTL